MLNRKQPKQKQSALRNTWLDVGGRDVPVTISENPRSQRLTLRIQPGGKELRVSVPPSTPFREIDSFLRKHQNWVAARLSRMPKVQSITAGEVINLRGVPHEIVHMGKGRGVVKTILQNEQFQIQVFGDERHMQRRVLDFLKNQARSDLAAAVEVHGARLGVKAKSISIRDSKTRWGSCSSSGTLSFSWRIILAPPDILDYLAAHEVAHLREMNHSPQFWALVEQTCAHTKSSRSWLKTHGAELHALII